MGAAPLGNSIVGIIRVPSEIRGSGIEGLDV
jgi:hypothetical protein